MSLDTEPLKAICLFLSKPSPTKQLRKPQGSSTLLRVHNWHGNLTPGTMMRAVLDRYDPTRKLVGTQSVSNSQRNLSLTHRGTYL